MYQFILPWRRERQQRIAFAIGVAAAALLLSPIRAEEDTQREHGPSNASLVPALSVTTLNMAKVKDPERVLNEWRAHPGIWNSDIILLQEVAHFASGRASVAQTLAQAMGRHVVSVPSLPNRDIDGLAIISRFPMTDFELTQLAHNQMVFHTRNRIAIAVTAHTPFGTLRVYNLHLDSRINSSARQKQIAPVLARAAQWDGPRLIGGDFNTNYFRWLGNVLPIGVSVQARALQAAMAEESFTTALTGSGPTSDFFWLHLDWLYTRAVEVVGTAVEPLRFTDHHAVRVTLAPLATLSRGTLLSGDKQPSPPFAVRPESGDQGLFVPAGPTGYGGRVGPIGNELTNLTSRR